MTTNGHSRQTVTVRCAKREDTREIYRLLIMAHTENGIYEQNNQKVEYFVQSFLRLPSEIADDDVRPRGAIGVIGQLGGRLEGLSMIGLGCLWYSTETYLEEFVVYIDPEYRRGTSRIRALLNWNMEQSRRAEKPLMTGIISNRSEEHTS